MNDLKQYICHMPGFFSKEFCRRILDSAEKIGWKEHIWQTQNSKGLKLYDQNEVDVCYLKDLELILRNELFFRSMIAVDEYQMLNQTNTGVAYIHDYRINRYQSNCLMRTHVDHIHDLFDGTRRGIPILSIIINLNEDYEGGELVFFDNLRYTLKTGDIVVFPSNFLFPHAVLSVKSGTRYSMVSWGY